jgi:hypothetical protein
MGRKGLARVREFWFERRRKSRHWRYNRRPAVGATRFWILDFGFWIRERWHLDSGACDSDGESAFWRMHSRDSTEVEATLGLVSQHSD